MACLTWRRPSPEVRSRTLHLLLSVQTTASHPSRAAGHQSQCQPIHRTAKTTKRRKDKRESQIYTCPLGGPHTPRARMSVR